MENINSDHFWSDRYLKGATGWDLGNVSTPIREYIDQLKFKDLKILIPGCGNAWEAAYLMQQGFTQVTLVDISQVLVENLQERFSKEIKAGHIRVIHTDFFEIKDQFDLILEQTFFCALPPVMRKQYVEKMHEILKPNGKIAGVMFNKEFEGGPPFGGNTAEYLELFKGHFHIKTLEPCHNSIAPRAGAEAFVIYQKQA